MTSFSYRMAVSNHGGFCDCNDPEAFKKCLGCNYHTIQETQAASEDEIVASIPDDIRERAIMITAAVKFIFDQIFWEIAKKWLIDMFGEKLIISRLCDTS